MSQHTYTLKFTISIHNPEPGTYLYGSQSHATKSESLSTVIGPDNKTKEDIIREKVEKKIREAIPTLQGIIQVEFDELTES